MALPKIIKVKNKSTVTTWDEVCSILLQNRGVASEEQKRLFFDATVAESVDALVKLFPQNERDDAINAIDVAMKEGKTIVIHGDYDVDGISATAILWEYLYRECGYKAVTPFIPHRTKHGYGLSKESIDEIVSTNQGKHILLITVDCGITAKEAIEYGRSLGVEFIVTDHHTIQEDKYPSGVPILHTYDLCGAGIAWVFALSIHRSKDSTSRFIVRGLDLVALATLADIQAVVGLNRVLVKQGLLLLSQTDRVGLQKLYEMTKLVGKSISTYEVGWVIAPRINAMGRLEHALDSLRLLCTTDIQKAEDIASLMHETNRIRQELTLRAIDQAIMMVQSAGWDDDFFIVVQHDDWHEGILGLIAGKLVERFGVPVIALGLSGDYYKGSARSIEGFDVTATIKLQQDLVEEAGGHAMAAGLTIRKEHVDQFRQNLNAYAHEFFGGEKPPRTYDVDLVMPFELVTMELAKGLEEFAPFGVGNPRPLFVSRDVVVLNRQLVGAEAQHLKLNIGTSTSKQLDAIAFNMGRRFDELELGTSVDIVYSIDVDTYFDTPRLQLKVKDFIVDDDSTL